MRPVKTVPGPTSTYAVTPSDARRRTESSQRTARRHLPHQRLYGRRSVALRAGVDVRDDRHPWILCSAGRAAPAQDVPPRASSARNGTAHSLEAARPSWRQALSRARRHAQRPTFVPAMTTWPAPFIFAGATTSPAAASSHACATLSASRPRIAAIAPVPTGTASCM